MGLHDPTLCSQVAAVCPPAESFSPYAVGYVELPEGIKVEAILDCDHFDELDRAPVSLVAISPVPRFAVGRFTTQGASQ